MLVSWCQNDVLSKHVHHVVKLFRVGFVAVLLLVGTYVAYLYLRKYRNHSFTWYLQNFTDIPSIAKDTQPHNSLIHTFNFTWKKNHERQRKHAMFQGKHMGQIDGQLYAPTSTKHKGIKSTYIELMGNLVTVFRQDKPSVSMYIHPQDTVLDIMQKFKLTAQDVLVVDGQRLDDLNKCLLQYGIPDNWKIDALVEPRTMSFDHSFREIFNVM
jgi:hypothetical protein